MPRATATQAEKYVAFKTAFQIIKQYQSQENYIGAYTVAFSVLEDRVRAMHVVRHSKITFVEPSQVKANGSLVNYAKHLCAQGDISAKELLAIQTVAKQRNQMLHAAMWNIGAFTNESVDEVKSLMRLMDKRRREQKHKFNKNM